MTYLCLDVGYHNGTTCITIHLWNHLLCSQCINSLLPQYLSTLLMLIISSWHPPCWKIFRGLPLHLLHLWLGQPHCCIQLSMVLVMSLCSVYQQLLYPTSWLSSYKHSYLALTPLAHTTWDKQMHFLLQYMSPSINHTYAIKCIAPYIS